MQSKAEHCTHMAPLQPPCTSECAMPPCTPPCCQHSPKPSASAPGVCEWVTPKPTPLTLGQPIHRQCLGNAMGPAVPPAPLLSPVPPVPSAAVPSGGVPQGLALGVWTYLCVYGHTWDSAHLSESVCAGQPRAGRVSREQQECPEDLWPQNCKGGF